MNYTACLPGSYLTSICVGPAIHFTSFHDVLASFAWMREMAHWADSETTGSADAASRVNTLDTLSNAAKSPCNFEFPSATHTLRIKPCHFVLLIGLPRNISVKSR